MKLAFLNLLIQDVNLIVSDVSLKEKMNVLIVLMISFYKMIRPALTDSLTKDVKEDV